MANPILIKPLLSHKSDKLANNPALRQYTFVVAKSANKIEIKKAVEQKFNVHVTSVNTSVRPGKKRARIVKGKMSVGFVPSIKKAVVTIAEGETIEGFYGVEEPAVLEETTTEDNAVNA